jgi:hypothetical protein
MAITRTPMIDDDGSGTTGTIINAAWKVELYDQIDAGLVAASASEITFGTWSPIIGGDGGESGQTYSDQQGEYIKIGRYVYIRYNVAFTNMGTVTGIVLLKGLPFVNTGMPHGFGALYWAGLAIPVVNVLSYIPAFYAALNLQYQPSAGGTSLPNMDASHLTNATRFTGAGGYIVAP